VYDGYRADREKHGECVECRIGHIPFNPEAHVRGYDSSMDIATFNFTYDLLNQIRDIQTMVPIQWPPPEPVVGIGVYVGGFPEEGRRHLRENLVQFGLHLGQTPITVVTDRQITCRLNRENWLRIADIPLPEQGANFSGISGGPLLLPVDHGEGVWNFHTIGVITQAHISPDYETIIAVRSHFINHDGTIGTSIGGRPC
jgi:hypothetical protein